MTLEQQLADLIRKHGLQQLSIHATDRGRVYAFAHRDGKLCGMSAHFDHVEQAIGDAIGKCPTNIPADVEPLAPMGEAA